MMSPRPWEQDSSSKKREMVSYKILGLALWILSVGGEDAARKVFSAVAGFMLVAALPTMLFLRERAQPGQVSGTEPDWRAVWKTVRDRPDLRKLLVGLGTSLTGLSAVVGFASIYATKEIGFTLDDTVKLFVVLQGAAVVGALATGPWQDRSGARPVLLSALGLWVLVSVGAWWSRSAWYRDWETDRKSTRLNSSH